jgi:hypothetical protein
VSHGKRDTKLIEEVSRTAPSATGILLITSYQLRAENEQQPKFT